MYQHGPVRWAARQGRPQGSPLRITGTGLLLALLIGCAPPADEGADGAAAAPHPVSATDDLGRVLRLDAPARRVLSLLPAATETVVALGAGDALVGRTRYDLDPALAHLPSVGGGLDPSLEAVAALDPDLVIAFETAGESRIRPRIEALGVPVFAVQAEDTADILRNIRNLGALLGRTGSADSLLARIREDLRAVSSSVPPGPRPRVVYVASIDPPIVAGPGTYIGEMIGVAGGELLAVGEARGAYWPQVSLEALVRAAPDLLVLPVGSDPSSSVARLRKEPGWRELEAVREGRIAVVSTDLVSRPGPHIARIAEALRDGIRHAGAGR